MIIQLSNKEFQELRKILIGVKNPKANKIFNEMFAKDSKSSVKGFVNPINNDIVINIPENLAVDVEKVFVEYSPDIQKLVKSGSSITNASKWLSCIRNVWSDILRVITKR